MKQILGVTSLDIIPFSAFEAVAISGSHVKVRTFKFFILFVMVDEVGNGTLLIETSLVDGIFGEIRLDDMELAQMPTALAVIAEALLLMMV